MDDTRIIAYCGFVTSLAGVIYTAINHKRIRSNCCGKQLEASLDIEQTSPAARPTTPSVPEKHDEKV
jgi:hypothetical protein